MWYFSHTLNCRKFDIAKNYPLFGVKFGFPNFCLCKKYDKSQVWKNPAIPFMTQHLNNKREDKKISNWTNLQEPSIYFHWIKNNWDICCCLSFNEPNFLNFLQSLGCPTLCIVFCQNWIVSNVYFQIIHWFSKHRPSGPMLSISWNVRVCVCLCVHFCGTV